MWTIFKIYGCQPTPIFKPSRLRRRKKNITASATIDISKTIEETVNVNETNPMPVEETEPAEKKAKQVNSIGSVEVSITNRVEEANGATQFSAKYLRCDKCGNIFL